VRRALLLFAALSTLLVACGDDDDDTGAATAAADDATGVAAGSTIAAGGTAAIGGSDYCTALATFKTARDDFAAVVADESSTPEQFETAITNEGDAFMALVEVAPADIATDLGAIAGPTDSLIEAFTEVDYDVASLTTDNAAAAEALNQLDGPDYIEATLSVDAYNQETCGITIGDWQVVAS
jgi:hypothetical protein